MQNSMRDDFIQFFWSQPFLRGFLSEEIDIYIMIYEYLINSITPIWRGFYAQDSEARREGFNNKKIQTIHCISQTFGPFPEAKKGWMTTFGKLKNFINYFLKPFLSINTQFWYILQANMKILVRVFFHPSFLYFVKLSM